MTQAIDVEGLVRSFGAIRAVGGLAFSVEHGEVFGLLGPNGAGKTTTLRLLNGVLPPSEGRMRVLDFDPTVHGCELRRHTGILTEAPSLYERLSARDNLSIFGALYAVPENDLSQRVEEMLALFGLSERASEKVGGFSKGMKQRLALARALLHRPPLLFLDEPTAGLDPEAARQVIQMIEDLSHQEGRTIVLCTHNLAEAQRLCDRVGVISQGRFLAVGALEEIARSLWQGSWVDIDMATSLSPHALEVLRTVEGIRNVESEGVHLAVCVEVDRMIPGVVSALVHAGAQIRRVNPRLPTLEDVYFRLQPPTRGGQA